MTSGLSLERYLALYMMLRGAWLVLVIRPRDLSPWILRAMGPLSPEGWGALYVLVGAFSLLASVLSRRRLRLVAIGGMIAVLSLVTWSTYQQASRSLLIPNTLGQLAGSMYVWCLARGERDARAA